MLLTNVAFIKHAEGQNQKAYLFSVPDHIILKAGDEVLCDTKKGTVPESAYPEVFGLVT